jgi:hypothetical protein
MNYTLITRDGQLMRFYLLGVARLYQELYGGKIITDEILVDKTNRTTV